jgi:hypothetical protein
VIQFPVDAIHWWKSFPMAMIRCSISLSFHQLGQKKLSPLSHQLNGCRKPVISFLLRYPKKWVGSLLKPPFSLLNSPFVCCWNANLSWWTPSFFLLGPSICVGQSQMFWMVNPKCFCCKKSMLWLLQ